jgi:hypothetical protein
MELDEAVRMSVDNDEPAVYCEDGRVLDNNRNRMLVLRTQRNCVGRLRIYLVGKHQLPIIKAGNTR